MPIDTIQHWIDLYGYAALFFGLVFGIVGLPVPDESLLALFGYLVSTGRFHFALTYAIASLGSLSGITLSYWIGRSGGYRLIHKYGPRFHLTEERLEKVHGWFDRIGKCRVREGPAPEIWRSQLPQRNHHHYLRHTSQPHERN